MKIEQKPKYMRVNKDRKAPPRSTLHYRLWQQGKITMEEWQALEKKVGIK